MSKRSPKPPAAGPISAGRDGAGQIGFSTCSSGRFFELDMISWGDIGALERTALAFVTSALDCNQRTIAIATTAAMTPRAIYLRMESLLLRTAGAASGAGHEGEATRLCVRGM